MRCVPVRLAALAIALFCSAAVYAQGQGLQLPRSSGVRDKTLPTILDADRIEGIAGKDTKAQGNAILRRGDLSIRADSLMYHEENEEVEAHGNVRLQRNGDSLSGPSLT
jgi:LPS-assembly protein